MKDKEYLICSVEHPKMQKDEKERDDCLCKETIILE